MKVLSDFSFLNFKVDVESLSYCARLIVNMQIRILLISFVIPFILHLELSMNDLLMLSLLLLKFK